MKWLFALLLFATLEPTAQAAKLRVVSTIETLGSIAREVGRDRVAVESLSHGYEDPHFVPASAAWLLKLKRADLFMVIGLEMETAWLGELLKVPSPVVQSRNPKIRLGSQGGSHTMSTLTTPTPGTLATAFSTMLGNSCAEGQLGVVSVISTATARSSAMSIL